MKDTGKHGFKGLIFQGGWGYPPIFSYGKNIFFNSHSVAIDVESFWLDTIALYVVLYYEIRIELVSNILWMIDALLYFLGGVRSDTKTTKDIELQPIHA